MLPLLRGLPQPVRTYWVVPLLRSPASRAFFARLTHPAAALPFFVATTWLWHAPAAYELALRSSGWHYLQHACFLAAGLLFWYPVVRPYPSHPRWSLWLLLPYLILADVQNTILSALLTFSDHVAVSLLSASPAAGRALRPGGSIGGRRPHVGTRFPGFSRTLVRDRLPASVRSRATGRPRAGRDGGRAPGAPACGSWVGEQVQGRAGLFASTPVLSDRRPPRLAERVLRAPGFDLLRVPLVGRFLKWRHARLAMQVPLVALAGVLIFDGLRGPQVGAMNLAGVLPWIHWRGLLILGFLVGGQLLLHGLSVSAAPDPGPPLAPDGPSLAALAAEQVAGGGPARAVSVGLRGV